MHDGSQNRRVQSTNTAIGRVSAVEIGFQECGFEVVREGLNQESQKEREWKVGIALMNIDRTRSHDG